MNPWSSGVLSFKEFLSHGFVVVVNLEKMRINKGKLQLRLKFTKIQSTKQVLVWMPVFEKKLIIDQNMDVAIE